MLTTVAALSLVYWLFVGFVLVRTLKGVSGVEPQPPLARWPLLSIVVAARDEEAEVERALRSKLRESAYPNLELIFVNDRSSDATGSIADSIAKEDPRLRVVHLQTLPEGWLGKIHAMQRGLEIARGTWVLFSDADVRFAPGTLKSVVAKAETENADHIAVLPHLDSQGRFARAALGAFCRGLIAATRLWAVSKQRSSAAIGIGAFNLVRRSTLSRTPGLQWLKMEVADDVALGVMLKRAGARALVLNGKDAVWVQYYPTYRALLRGLEKNGADAPFALLVLGAALLCVLEAGFLLGGPVLASLGLVLAVAVSKGTARWVGLQGRSWLLPPLGMGLFAFAFVRSAGLALWRGGVLWRDTFYPTAQVRAGRRLGQRAVRSEVPNSPI